MVTGEKFLYNRTKNSKIRNKLSETLSMLVKS